MAEPLRVVILEPYYGGSHAAFVDAMVAHSRHECTLVAMPARKWKWRMRGAAAWMTREGGAWLREGVTAPDVILCNDMLSVADLRALLPSGMRNVPIACYFHENQLTYPLSDDDRRDYQYGMTNIMSCLAADAVWFNSCYHREAFLAAAGRLLAKMPDHVPTGIIDEIRGKSVVLYPPVNVPDGHLAPLASVDALATNRRRPKVMTILWSHRWEYDKNPEAFFRALLELDASGRAFGLVVTGEQFRTAPPVFADSWDRLRPHIRHAGFLSSREDYVRLIQSCDVMVSSAIQENFGIAVVEAILAGCQPLLPDRLAYTEVIPSEFHESCLYKADSKLADHLKSLADGHGWLNPTAFQGLRQSMLDRFACSTAVKAIDDGLAELSVR